MCVINPHIDSKISVCVCVFVCVCVRERVLLSYHVFSVLFSTSVCVDLVFNVVSHPVSHPLNLCWNKLDPDPAPHFGGSPSSCCQ